MKSVTVIETILEIAKFHEPQYNWEISEEIYIGAKPPYKKFVGWRYPAYSGWIYARDYVNDFNAINAAKMKLNRHQQDVFAGYLADIVGNVHRDFGAQRINTTTRILFATCPQHAEALLYTINAMKYGGDVQTKIRKLINVYDSRSDHDNDELREAIGELRNEV